MTNTLTFGKRVFTMAIVAATALWSVVGALAAPSIASAAMSYSNGDLIKGESLSTVYYYYGEERFTFPNELTYKTWYEDFDDVMEVSDSALAAIPLAGNITVRPGTWMIKVQSDPKAYVVDRGGELHWVESEDAAKDLYGDNWNKWIMDVADVFFTDYETGVSMTEAMLTDGMLVKDGSTTYMVWDGKLREVSSAGMTANRLQSRFVMSDSSVDLSDYDMGSEIASEVASVSDTSQQATTDTAADGGLMVSLNDDSPSGQTIPASATNVQLMAVDFKATEADVTVSNVTLDFVGVADESVLTDVYLYANGARLTNGKSINSTTREVTFSGLGLDIAKGDTETVWVTADVAADPGTASVAFEIESEDAVTSTAETVDGDFPVTGDKNSLTSSAEVGQVTIDATGSLSDVTIGEEEAEISRFTIEAQYEDAEITSITLNVDQADDHSDYQLWQSSTKLATGEAIGNDLVLFELDDAYTVLDGNTKTFKVTASIGGDPGDSISTALEETSDLTAIGGDFGFGMTVTNTGFSDTGDSCTGANCSQVDIIGGKLTFAFNGPSASTDLQIGGDDQDLFEFTLTSQNTATINAFDFDIVGADLCDNTDGNFENFRVVKAETGATLMGPQELDCNADDAGGTLTFDDEFDMEAGDSMDLMLVADISDAGSADETDTITATLLMDSVDAEDAQGNDLSLGEDVIPSADLAGHTLGLNDASLTIDVASTPSSGSVVKGSQDVDMVGFSFEAGDASDIMVTDATFSILVETTTAETNFEGGEDSPDFDAQDYITSCSLYSTDGDLVDGPESVNSDVTVDFSGFDWTVAAGESERLIVNCNLANIDLVNDADGRDRYAVRLDDVTAEDVDGDEITADINDSNDTVPTTVIDVTGAGELTVALGADSPDATIIIGSSSDVEVATFRFTASAEAYNVDTLTFTNSGDDSVAEDVSVSYEDEDGVTKTKTSTLSGGVVSFSNLDMYVPADSSADVSVTINTNSVSSSGATAGDVFALSLDMDSETEYFSATGVDSGETLTADDIAAVIDADSFELHKTKPTVSKASGSPSGSSIPSSDEVLRFNVAADSHGYVTLTELTFKMVSTDKAGSDWNTCDGTVDVDPLTDTSFSIYNYDDLGVQLEADESDWDLYDSAGANCGADNDIVYLRVVFDNAVEIAAGDTETFSLYADTTTASSEDSDAVHFDLPRQSELVTAANGALTIGWEDDTTGEGPFDGTYIKTLPVTGGTLVY